MCLLLSFTGCSAGAAVARVEQQPLATSPGAPLIVPSAVPSGYVYFDGTATTSSNGYVDMRSITYRPVDLNERASLVTVCVDASDEQNRCPESGVVARRRVAGSLVIVYFWLDRSAADARAWAAVGLVPRKAQTPPS